MSLSREIELLVRPRGKEIPKLPESTKVALSWSTSNLHAILAAQSGYSANRLRITKGSDGSLVPNSKLASIESTGLRDRSTIYVKDLGPQIPWKTVFFVEYAGPLFIHPLVYLLRRYIYASPPLAASGLQTLSLALVLVHFLKREAETQLVHRFSNASMPARNIFKNSFHYWLLAGANLAYWLYSPRAAIAHTPATSPLALVGVCLFLAGELGNLSAHLTLRQLRQPGSTARGIPCGFGFGWVTCPNYLFEIVAWTGFLLVSRSWATALFLGVSGAQMVAWARKKESKYRKEFPGQYKPKRYTILPGLV
ncbi:MAG: 3-oxo-5a-steroid 4- dehydrogenase [Trizodia sp. TS-e1964]|nr:MAG: 3-oxo-5a-steroid 4- dehydrogenase [Trizodia sp. TS-e1964]